MSTRIFVESPVGILTLQGDERSLTNIELPSPRSRAPGTPSLTTTAVSKPHLPRALAAAVEQLNEYFSGGRREFDLPIELDGTSFQRAVWSALADIPYGKTVSYAELACKVRRPKAFRAVGQANGANPLPIVLPCHRVVASGGRIGGYGGGLQMKRYLLELEGITGL